MNKNSPKGLFERQSLGCFNASELLSGRCSVRSFDLLTRCFKLLIPSSPHAEKLRLSRHR